MAPPPPPTVPVVAPKSILKKRSRQVAEEPESDQIQQVPQAGPASERDAIINLESEEESDQDSESEDEDDFDAGSDSDEDTEEEEDDEDAIKSMTDGKVKPVKKLKHTTLRPTPAPSFSLALNHLLSLPPSTSSLKPKNAPSTHSLKLERRARGLIRETKANHLSRGHVRDVIAGWGPRPNLPFSQWESKTARDFEKARAGGVGLDGVEGETGMEREKRLRRLAQRGVVRLFNAIAAAQGAPEKVEKMEMKRRKLEGGDADAESTATTIIGAADGDGAKLRRPNVLGGRGKGEALSNLSKASFLDLIRAGTTTAR